MSNDMVEDGPVDVMSKEEKKKRKEVKKAKKLAREAGVGESEGLNGKEDKKEKKDKRAKDKKDKKDREKMGMSQVEDEYNEVKQTTENNDAPTENKSKKEKKRKRKEGELDVVESSATASSGNISGDKESKRDKKKKVQHSDATTVTIDTSKPVQTTTPSSSLSTTFTPIHHTYLSTNGITLTPSIYPPHLSISTLPVPTPLLAFLKQFQSPTPIQACSWPALLAGKDVVGIAETGSGKTLAFGVPALTHLHSKSNTIATIYSEMGTHGKKGTGKGKSVRGGNVGVLVLAPTRELAQQSHENLSKAGAGMGIASTCIFGGVPKDPQVQDLSRKEVKVIVGTPGRTLDLADSGDLDLSNITYLVLDEADRMLDQGFENDIRRIIAHCPGHEGGRQTVMFSATWPESVRRLASTFLKNPIKVTVGSDELSANKRIEQIVEVIDNGRMKDPRMLHHLKTHLKAHPSTPAAPTRILVFALYKKEAQRLEYTIQRAGYSVAGLHGDLDQTARFKALDKFKTGQVNIMVATDVAARGLDIPDVGLVLNVTFPLTTEDFVHRCGRTGRAGKSGKAVTFFTGEAHEKSLAGEFMRVLRDVGAEVPKEMDRFPTTIKKKEHGSYGAFYKDVSNAPAPTKITFD